MTNENNKNQHDSSAKNQYYAAFVVNIICFCYGCTIGWVSPALPLLLSSDSPLSQALTSAESYLVASSVCITATFCTPIYGWISDRYGRRTSLVISGVPYIISWVMKITWYSSTGLILARLLVGLGGAGVLMLSPIYSVEIASIEVKGILGSLMIFSINGGILFMYILGELFDYVTVIALMIPLPVIYVGLMYMLPETPSYLVQKNRIMEASKSISWLRSVPVNSKTVKDEIEALKNGMSSENDIKMESAWRIFSSSCAMMKAFTVLMTLITIACCMGSFAIVSYAVDIFKEAGTEIPPSTCSIILGSLLLAGSVIASSLVEKLGRKVLLISSCFIVGLSMFTMAVFLYLQSSDFDLNSWKLVPVIALSLALCTSAMGAGPIPFILPSEILPVQVRSTMTSVILTWFWFLSFLVAACFGPAVSFIGMSGVFVFFGLSSWAGVIVTVFCIPETKGKSVEESMAFYEDDKKSNEFPII